MRNWAIRAEGLSKKFGLTLRQSMKYGLHDVAQRLLGARNGDDVLRTGEFWAVDDVNFELRSGEALGIMGVNGSGKTTLLRILNGVYAPDRGKVRIRGRVGALIAAGAGFAPMLSGRENVYINGSLLGLTTKEIKGLMDEIVAFSELGDFIDLPVKNYSSGMYVRLGFAVAALSRPDVLLMDEVLAVGDLNFQKKCFDQILQLKRSGTAIVLVSHSPGAVWSVCDRGLFMDHGRAVVEGGVEDVVRAYDDQNSRNAIAADQQFSQAAANSGELQLRASIADAQAGAKVGTGDVVCTDFRIVRSESEAPAAELEFREPFFVEVDVTILKPIDDFILRVVADAMHYRNIVTLDNYEQGCPIGRIEPGHYRFRIDVTDQNFRPGAYIFNVAVVSRKIGVHLFLWLKCARIVVRNPRCYFLYSDPMAVVFFGATYSHVRLETSS